MLRMLFKLFEDRVIVVSDAMRAGGMPDGVYDLGGIDVESRGGRTFFGPGGNLAGSVTNPAQEAERLFSYGVPEQHVIKAMTYTPRKRLNIEEQGFSSSNTTCMNFVDDSLRLKSVISRGRLVSPYVML
jgi:N-acetylglucosamine-6-phosphate deacetylase